MDAPSIQKLGEMHFAGGGDVDKMTVEALKACLWNLFRPAGFGKERRAADPVKGMHGSEVRRGERRRSRSGVPTTLRGAYR